MKDIHQNIKNNTNITRENSMDSITTWSEGEFKYILYLNKDSFVNNIVFSSSKSFYNFNEKKNMAIIR